METFIYIYSDLFFLKSNTVDPVFLSKREGELMCSLRSSAIFSLCSGVTVVVCDD